MRYSPNELNRKRGRKKTRQPEAQASEQLALICSYDDYLMTPALEPKDPEGRTRKRILFYVCPNCGNKINPLVEPATNAMTVQTRDNAIQYRGKHKSIQKNPKRSYSQTKKDDLDKFIQDKLPQTNDMWVNVTKRVIEKRGAKHFKIVRPS